MSYASQADTVALHRTYVLSSAGRY